MPTRDEPQTPARGIPPWRCLGPWFRCFGHVTRLDQHGPEGAFYAILRGDVLVGLGRFLFRATLHVVLGPVRLELRET